MNQEYKSKEMDQNKSETVFILQSVNLHISWYIRVDFFTF